MIKALIFDMDGVILDTEKLFFKYWRLAAKIHGYEMSQEVALHIRSFSGAFAKPYFAKTFGADFDYMAVRATRKQLMEADLEQNGIPLKPGITELLSYLKEQGILTAIATSTDYERTERYLSKLGLLEQFDRIICAPMVRVGKPAPDIYLYACEQLSLSPADCLAVEDSPNGIKSAFDAGCRVCMVPDLTQPDENVLPMLTVTAESLLDLKRILAAGEVV